MYLTRAFLDPSSRAVRADLQDPAGLHKTVMRAFPDGAGPAPRFREAIAAGIGPGKAYGFGLLSIARPKP